MKKAIIRSYIIILLISLAITSALSFFLLSFGERENTEQQMSYAVKLIDYSMDYQKNLNQQIAKMQPLISTKNTRISIISSKGKVLADTYKTFISENHLHRQEVQQALHASSHEGYAIRASDTTKEKMLYVAYYHHGYIVRLSIPYRGLAQYLPLLIPALSISFVISFLISLLIARIMSKRIASPLNEIDYALQNMSDDYRFELHTYPYEEFNHIVNTIEDLSHRLRKAKRETRFEQKKIDDIIDRMKEGFILLDEDNNILSINQAAMDIVGPQEVNSHLEDGIDIDELNEALKKQSDHEKIEFKLNNNYYKCYLSRFPFGTALFFVDITAVRNNEKMREEFFSSVSHELKTPITAIRGYTELMLAGVVTDQAKERQMLEKILTQVKNMSNLINDILMLSRLDNDDLVVERVPIRMKTLVNDVLENYEGLLLKEKITVEKNIDDITYIGNNQQISNLLSNLISNAIKYNKPGGQLFVSVYSNNDDMVIKVEDTGIGIPEKDQQRVFERFYRVDKGRSRAKGGTGLGLAIVKHITSYNNGKIHLSSTLGVGTCITITLPLNHPKA